jgi:hypothetical protein
MSIALTDRTGGGDEVPRERTYHVIRYVPVEKQSLLGMPGEEGLSRGLDRMRHNCSTLEIDAEHM